MARGQKRGRDEPEQLEDVAAAGPRLNAASDGGQPADRRAQMAEIARRRAAHFANFQEGAVEEAEDNVHVGGTQARKLGMWSSAVELINEREKATEKRLAKLQDGARTGAQSRSEAQKQAYKPIEWEPRRNPALGPRPACSVPSLRTLCQTVLVDYIDCVESLAGVPDTIRSDLAMAVCAKRKLNAEIARTMAQDAPTELVLPDCSPLDRDALVTVIREVITPRLERLELGMCGRGFGDNTMKKALPGAASLPQEACEAFHQAASLCPGKCLPHLTHLRLSGAYRLNTEGLVMVLRVCPGLRQLEIPDASRVTSALLSHLTHLTPHLRRLDLGDCRALDAESLSSHLPQLPHLTHITLDGILEVDDSVVRAVGEGCKQLTHLSMNRCLAVTDTGIAALAASRPGLLSLKCNMCDKVTDKGLQALATHCHGLKNLAAQKLPRISDSGLVSIAENGSLQRLTLHSTGTGVTDTTLQALMAHCQGCLEYLDISFCRGFSSEALGALADTCTQLQQLVVFGCSQLTDRMAHGHTNSALASGGLVGVGTSVTVAA